MKSRLLLAVALALVVASCGGSDAEPAATEAATTVATTEDTAMDMTEESTMAEDMEDMDMSEDDAASGGHQHDGGVATELAMSVAMDIQEDAIGGWNVFLTTENFTFAPEHASGDNIDGEGHAHWYIDGEKQGRVYANAFHIGSLEPGSRTIMVELNGNNHSPYIVNGSGVTVMATIDVAGEATDDANTAAPVTIEIAIAEDGTVTAPERPEIPLGSDVQINVTGHAEDDVHLHGYDILVPIAHGTPAVLRFTADVAGIFEIELENAQTPLISIEVS